MGSVSASSRARELPSIYLLIGGAVSHVGGIAVDLPVCVRAGAGAAAVQVLRAVHCGLVEGN